MEKSNLQTDQMSCLGSSREITGDLGFDLKVSIFRYHVIAKPLGLLIHHSGFHLFPVYILSVKRLKPNKTCWFLVSSETV